METYIMVSPSSVLPAAATLPTTSTQQTAAAAAIIARTPAPTVHVHDLPVSAAQRPHIHIDGPRQHLVTYQDIKRGVRILANATLRILSGTRAPGQLQQLDSCAVTVFPALNPDHETLTLDLSGFAGRVVAGLPDASIFRGPMDIKTSISSTGVQFVGYDATANYADMLHALVYTNRKPAYYLNRVFKVQCAQVSGQFRSADFAMTLTVSLFVWAFLALSRPTHCDWGC